jgi:deglycase
MSYYQRRKPMASHKLQGLRVAALAADGFEQVELTVPMKALKRAGATVEIVSLRPGTIRGMNLLLPGKQVAVDRLVGAADPAAYDALLLPGGFINPDFLRQSEDALEFVRAFDVASKPIAVICHGPWVLVSAGLVRGRVLTSWPGIKHDLINAGAVWENRAVIRDGNWVSSRGPHDLRKFKKAMIELFEERMAVLPSEAATAGAGQVWVAPGRWLVRGLLLAGAAYGLRRLAAGAPAKSPRQQLAAWLG